MGFSRSGPRQEQVLRTQNWPGPGTVAAAGFSRAARSRRRGPGAPECAGSPRATSSSGSASTFGHLAGSRCGNVSSVTGLVASVAGVVSSVAAVVAAVVALGARVSAAVVAAADVVSEPTLSTLLHAPATRPSVTTATTINRPVRRVDVRQNCLTRYPPHLLEIEAPSINGRVPAPRVRCTEAYYAVHHSLCRSTQIVSS